jgi:nucleoid-associated protein YgaU
MLGRDAPRASRGVRDGGVAVGSVRGGCARLAPAPYPGPLRLTERGHHVLAGVVLAVALGLCALVGPVLGNGSADLRTVGQGSVVVEPGDTLWSIATSVSGTGQDVRAVVDEIRRVNGLASADLVPGQVLALP